MEELNLSNIINCEGLKVDIKDCCKKLDGAEELKARMEWKFIMRSKKLNFICERCSIRVKAFAVEYDCVLANYDNLLPFTLTCSYENIDLIKIISKYTKNILIDSYGKVWFDIKLSYSDLMDLKYDLEDYWKTHQLCSNKVDKYRRIVVKALGAEIYK